MNLGKGRPSILIALEKRCIYLAVISIYNLCRLLIIPFEILYKKLEKDDVPGKQPDLQMPVLKDPKPLMFKLDNTFSNRCNLVSLIENINKNSSFEEILRYIYSSFSVFIPYTYIGIALIKDNGKILQASYGISGGSMDNRLSSSLLGKSYKTDETSLGKILASGKPRMINDLDAYVKGKEIREYTKIIMDAGIRSSITLPLYVSGRTVGIIFFSSREKNVYTKAHVEILSTLANSIAVSMDKTILIDELLYGSILALVKLAEARDEDTGGHLDRIKQYSSMIAQFLYDEGKYREIITPRYISDIERFSPMHDIGKVGIRDAILLKPGKLTPAEFEEMKHHALYGENVLKAAEGNVLESGRSLFRMGMDIAGCHHEKWDGTGYPYGKSGESIPLCARIVALADVFDALTSKRPYKEAYSIEKSLDIIKSETGTHFDPSIVEVFLKNMEKVKMSQGTDP